MVRAMSPGYADLFCVRGTGVAGSDQRLLINIGTHRLHGGKHPEETMQLILNTGGEEELVGLASLSARSKG